MACSLIEHKRIETTVAKARELRKFVEPLLTKAKTDSTHSRRIVFSYLQNKEILKELFGPVSERIGNRPGGYTRIIKLGTRLGDNASLALIELVDFNDLLLTEAKPAKAKTRRSRRAGGAGDSLAPVAAAPVAETVAAAPVAETSEAEASVTETTVAEISPASDAEFATDAKVVGDADAEVAADDATDAPADQTPEAPAATEEAKPEQA